MKVSQSVHVWLLILKRQRAPAHCRSIFGLELSGWALHATLTNLQALGAKKPSILRPLRAMPICGSVGTANGSHCSWRKSWAVESGSSSIFQDSTWSSTRTHGYPPSPPDTFPPALKCCVLSDDFTSGRICIGDDSLLCIHLLGMLLQGT